MYGPSSKILYNIGLSWPKNHSAKIISKLVKINRKPHVRGRKTLKNFRLRRATSRQWLIMIVLVEKIPARRAANKIEGISMYGENQMFNTAG